MGQPRCKEDNHPAILADGDSHGKYAFGFARVVEADKCPSLAWGFNDRSRAAIAPQRSRFRVHENTVHFCLLAA